LQIGDRELVTKHVVIATGASPRVLGIPGEEHVVSSTEFLELPALPGRIAFVGVGYIAMEFSHLAAVAGASITMFGRGRPLSHFDDELVDRLLAHTRAAGVRVHLSAPVTAVERTDAGLRVQTAARGEWSDEFDLVVHGAGRVPNTAHLGLSAAGIPTDEGGAITVNEYLQSVANPCVYAVGDVTLPQRKLPLTPVAAHEGAIVAANLLRGNVKRPNYDGIPSVVFTLPPLASVGLTERAARESGLDVEVKSGDTSSWYSNRRTRQPVGMFKTIVERATDRLIGAHLLGEHADEAINLFALAMRSRIPVRDLKQAIYSYPTSSSDLPFML
jgi:glutathione reductase (NADPH)